MTVQETLAQLKTQLAPTMDLRQAQALLSWDQNVYLPPGAASARGQQLATLGGVIHKRGTDPQLGEWLDSLEAAGADEGDTQDAALVRVARRNFEQATKLPGAFVEDFAKARSASQAAWVGARAGSDFSQFAPHLAKMVDFNLQQAELLGFEAHPYDALHDLFERGSTAERLRTVFAELRDALVPLLQNLSGQENSDAPLRQAFPEAEQEAFAVGVIRAFGYDFEHGRLDRTVHPFATSFSKYDVRITTRYGANLSPALFGTLHEAGHAMYEQGISSDYDRSPLGTTVSLGIHESQSRLWENLVGRSQGFWRWAYPKLQETFPAQLDGVLPEDFYRAINRVSPSLIRVEADEVTYNLHIMVRFELELELIEGTLKASELPEAWNAKYEEYLGVTPPNDAKGCLQDIHWSLGMFGYFPTYTLGNLVSVQLFDAVKAAHPEVEGDIQHGHFDNLLGWLRENIHQHGSRYEPAELLERATGQSLEAGPYIRYLKEKFGALYGVTV